MDAITALAAKAKGQQPADREKEPGRVYTLESAQRVGESQEWRERSVPLRAGLTMAVVNELCQLPQGEHWDQGGWDDFNQDCGGTWECHDPGFDFNQAPHWGDELPMGWEETTRNLLEDVEKLPALQM